MKNPLSVTHPQITTQWHPTKNGELMPDDVVAGSHKTVWWKCSNGADHEWDAPVKKRTQRGDGCPFCSGRRPSVTNSLASLYPEIAKQWHFAKNGTLTPEQVVTGSNKKVWWICPHNSDHEWEARIIHRVNGVGCPCCSGRKSSSTNSLASLYPEIAKEWHPTKNGDLTPDQMVAGSAKKAWWLCSNNFDHEWETSIRDRVKGTKCPLCTGHKVSDTNSLASLYPEIAAQWHPTKNGDLTPDNVTAYSNKKVWWLCPKKSDHEWDAVISSRVKGKGCACCRGLRASNTNSLASLYPELAAQWHPTKNGTLTPDQVVAASHKKVWWKCPKGLDHEWHAVVKSRTRGTPGCPFCDNQKLSVTNSLTSRFPEIAKEWHPDKNGTLTPEQVIAGTATRVWWRCSINPSHEWQALISNRTQHGVGCPACKNGWTVGAIRGFIASLVRHLGTFTPAELYLLFQQSGLLQTTGKGKSFVKALTTGRFPTEEIEKFVNGESSTVDKFLQDKQLTLEALETDARDVTSNIN